MFFFKSFLQVPYSIYATTMLFLTYIYFLLAIKKEVMVIGPKGPIVIVNGFCARSINKCVKYFPSSFNKYQLLS